MKDEQRKSNFNSDCEKKALGKIGKIKSSRRLQNTSFTNSRKSTRRILKKRGKKMINSPIERDVETLIDLQLRKLGWEDAPKNPNRNIWKQQPKTDLEKKKLGNLKPDYILYKTGTNIPLLVIEAKRPNIDVQGALIQGLNYAKKINAPLVMATNGIIVKTIHVKTGNFLRLDEEEVDSFFNENIAIKFIDSNNVVTISKKVISSRNELIKIFKDASNLLRKEGLLAGHERFSAFSNILFLKLMSEIQEIKEKNGEKNLLPYEYRWNFFKKKSGNELLSYINNIVLKEFDLFYKSGDKSIFGKLGIKNPSNLKEIINQLDQLQLTEIESDIKGDAFEYFLKSYNAGEKDLGEYFTPRHIVKFLVTLLNPKFGEKVYDPFCGTGGMLIECFKHLSKYSPNNTSSIKFLKEESLFGREISSTAKIAKMNMILIGDGHNNIERIDSLKNPVKNKYDVVITNMPFSQETEYGGLYDLYSKDANSICIQHCVDAIDSASENGRIGIIVPEKVLFDKNYKELRKKIYDTCKIENIISLPSGVFEPYTNVQTSIIHLTKVKQKTKSKNIKFYFVKNDGYSLNKNRSKLNGENDLDNFFLKSNEENYIDVGIEKIIKNSFILQGKKYIDPKLLAELTFNTKKLIKVSEILKKVKNEKIIRVPSNDYEVLGVRSYGLGLFKKQKKGYELSNGMNYFKSKENHLFFCKVDTKNGAFGIVTDKFKECIFTSNMCMLEINKNKMVPYFIEILFRNKQVQGYFDNYISGTTNRKYVKIDELLNFYIPDYSKDIQRTVTKQVIKSQNKIKEYQKIIDDSVSNIIFS
jgi:type I restriction enzyme M protein